jgi:mannose-6-phosphate isomerase-like protein (cupin superfamily)
MKEINIKPCNEKLINQSSLDNLMTYLNDNYSINNYNHSINEAELINIPKGSAKSFNTNKEEEILFVKKGSGGITINGRSFLVKLGETFHISKNSIRSIANIELEPLQVISLKYRAL